MHAGAQLLRPSRLSIPSFFYIGYVLMIYAPAFVVFTENTPPTRDVSHTVARQGDAPGVSQIPVQR